MRHGADSLEIAKRLLTLSNRLIGVGKPFLRMAACGAVVVLTCNSAFASHEEFDKKHCDVSYTWERCLSGDQPSYFVYVPWSNNAFHESHGEFKLSIKYPLFRTTHRDYENAFYFGYTGAYDFYAISDVRHSSPVISRQQNPGVFYKTERTPQPVDPGFKSLSVGWYHESNGQDIDSASLLSARVADIQSRPEGTGLSQAEASAIASDNLSRGWDYLGVVLKLTTTRDVPLLSARSVTDIYLSGRLYCDCQAAGFISANEDYIEGVDPVGTHIYDYNAFKIILSRILKEQQRVADDASRIDKVVTAAWLNSRHSVSLASGYRGNHISLQYQMTFRVGEQLPVTLIYFRGYGENLSTYYQSSQYLGLGLELW